MSIEDLRGRVLVDTNALLYATLAGDSRHERAWEVLAKRHRPEVSMFLSVQNLAEMYPNLTGPKNQPPDSPDLARRKILSLARLRGPTALPLTPETTLMALDLCVAAGITRQAYFDRQLAALMLREGIPVILTENAPDWHGIDGITAINPFA